VFLFSILIIMGTKLFVGSLSWGTTDATLKEAFEKAGTVEDAVVISDRMSGRSKGFGFVTMATPEEAQAAIDMWHEKELDGRKIIVNEARPKEER
jgi:cold-inducible RNA-binding protein